MALMELESVTKTFGGIHALEDIDLVVNQGDIVGLVGDNGAGKSTMVKILSGVYTPNQGRVLIDGVPQILSSPARAQHLGIETVYQDLALIGSFTVAENFFLGRERAWGGGSALTKILNRRSMAQTATASLSDLNINIPRVRNQPVDRMSGGQRQMAAIARGAFWGSRVLLLDEPTAALGVRESGEVLELIQRLADRGLTIFMVTHNLDHLWKACNRVIVMRRGKKAADMRVDGTSMNEVVSYITGAKGEGWPANYA